MNQILDQYVVKGQPFHNRSGKTDICPFFKCKCAVPFFKITVIYKIMAGRDVRRRSGGWGRGVVCKGNTFRKIA